MEQADVKQVIEAVLLVFGQPVALKRLTELMPDVEAVQLRATIQSLNTEYESAGRAFQIQEVAGGYQLVTKQELAPWVRKALQSPKADSVSAATMETLAIIAYRQPITKAEIEAIRGVDVTASLDTLLERKFARIAGRKDSPGRPFLYGTTPEFLRHFGLKSIEALPPMATPTIPEPVAAAPAQATSEPEPAPAASDGS
ncbi:MAG: SMC-Scp complex subunit ScpB [Candidatus Omnitrophica bacterium CG11_big_fil_rev_8_21_14_0_20_63_9]|nr:MAG: SMC-Scp complex subunit ScpB [Candidatus Omnitrophica bacterium CG11_big_fil_rev_8_21_14_0_20_63_9]